MKMLTLFILDLYLLLFTPDCQEHFAGTWKYEQYTVEQIYVERTAQKQFEYVNNGKEWFEYRVEWISDCSYILTYVGTNSTKPPIVEIGESFQVEINFENDSTMHYKTTFRGNMDEGVMYRIQ